MDWLIALLAGGVIFHAGWFLANELRTDPKVDAAEVEKAHAAEVVARREAVACLNSLIRQRESNVCLWEALGEYSQMLADTMGVAEEFGASEGMAFLAGEMGGERWSRIVGLAEKAKR